MMATNVATGLEIEFENDGSSESGPFRTPHSALRTRNIRPVTWEEWIKLPIRDQDEAVHTVRGQIRVPTVIVAVNYAKVPKKRPKLCAKAIRERDDNRCQYTGRVLRPDEGSLDHVVPRSRGGKDAWENLVWSAKDVNQRKADRLPHEAGLKLRSVPRAPSSTARSRSRRARSAAGPAGRRTRRSGRRARGPTTAPDRARSHRTRRFRHRCPG